MGKNKVTFENEKFCEEMENILKIKALQASMIPPHEKLIQLTAENNVNQGP